MSGIKDDLRARLVSAAMTAVPRGRPLVQDIMSVVDTRECAAGMDFSWFGSIEDTLVAEIAFDLGALHMSRHC